MKNRLEMLLVLVMLTLALTSVQALSAGDSTANSKGAAAQKTKPVAEKEKAKRDWYPFGGTVVSVDKSANTLSLKKKTGGRVLKLDAKSKLEIEGKPVTLGSVKVGNYAHGKLHKDSAGKEVITSAKFDKEALKKKKTAEKDLDNNPTPEPDE